MTESDCDSQGGVDLGGCASGFGVCCGFMAKDGRDVVLDKKVIFLALQASASLLSLGELHQES